MNIYLTEIENTCICGPRITAKSEEEAQKIADGITTTIGKIKVIGKLICEFEDFSPN